jgi:hypothetical protein
VSAEHAPSTHDLRNDHTRSYRSALARHREDRPTDSANLRGDQNRASCHAACSPWCRIQSPIESTCRAATAASAHGGTAGIGENASKNSAAAWTTEPLLRASALPMCGKRNDHNLVKSPQEFVRQFESP